MNKQPEAQEEAIASYDPVSEVLESQFLLLLVKWVIKAQPGFKGRKKLMVVILGDYRKKRYTQEINIGQKAS